MILENGTLQLIMMSGGGFQDGDPIPITEEVGAPISCNIRTIQHDKKGTVVDNEFIRASFEVLIDGTDAPHFTSEKVRLTDNRGTILGDFRVQNVQHLDYVQAVKLLL